MYFKYFSVLWLSYTAQCKQISCKKKGGHPKGDIHMDLLHWLPLDQFSICLHKWAILLTPCRGFISGHTRMKQKQLSFYMNGHCPKIVAAKLVALSKTNATIEQ